MLTNFLPQKTSFSSPKAFSSLAFRQNQQTTSPAETIGMQSSAEKNLSSSLKPSKNIAFKGFLYGFNMADIFTKKNTLESFFKTFDGAQKGIKVFEGLNIVQTFIATSNLYSFPLMRGCRNACRHCYADAQFPIKNTETHISSPLWEDFGDLVSGIEDFKKRIGLKFPASPSEIGYMIPFWDSEVIPAKIPDLKGGFHGAAEAVELLHEKLHKPIMIDTAAWPIQEKWSQTQAQELARYFKENPNALLGKINVSVNLFGKLMEKSFALKNDGKQEASAKMEKKYIDRMANTFLTFLECGVYSFNKAHDEVQYSQKELHKLNRKISDRIEEIAEQRGMRDVKSLKLDELNKSLLSQYIELILPYGRGADLFAPIEVANRKSKLRQVSSDLKKANQFFEGPKLFDLNGRVYVANDFEQIDTGIQLNFRNKDKKTAPFNNFIHQE